MVVPADRSSDGGRQTCGMRVSRRLHNELPPSVNKRVSTTARNFSDSGADFVLDPLQQLRAMSRLTENLHISSKTVVIAGRPSKSLPRVPAVKIGCCGRSPSSDAHPRPIDQYHECDDHPLSSPLMSAYFDFSHVPLSSTC